MNEAVPCQDCDNYYPIWWVANEEWNRTVGTPENPRGEGIYLCLKCFMRRWINLDIS